jgi:AraC-like DNA-binding protein
MPIFREQTPPESHARWIESVWMLESGTDSMAHRVAPDGCVDIVYGPIFGLRAIGTMTVEQQFQFSQNVCMTGIRFRPGMAGTFLGVSPAELTDGSAAMEDVWQRGGLALKRLLDDAKSIQEAMGLLLGRLPVPEEEPNPVQRAIGAIAAANGNADLDRIAGQANLSPRQFRRRCLEESGLTPKRLCRVLRFQHACRIAGRADRLSWADIALEAEYFDQAHLIRDFQDFTGQPPMAVFSNPRSTRSR